MAARAAPETRPRPRWAWPPALALLCALAPASTWATPDDPPPPDGSAERLRAAAAGETSQIPASAWALHPWQEFVGRPVLGVRIQTPNSADAVRLRGVVDIAEGVLLSASDVQEAVKRLFASGRFGQVEVLACLDRGAVILRFVLYPQPRVADLEIAGLAHVDVSDLRLALRVRGNDEASPATEAALRRRALAFLHRRGYPAAQVEIDWRPTGEPGFRLYRLRFDQGAAQRAQRVVVEGSPRLPLPLVLSMLATDEGTVIDQDVLDEDRRVLLEAYRGRGFLLARVAPARLVQNAAGGWEVHLRIEAGERLHVSFVGNHLMPDSALNDMFALPRGEPVPRFFESMRGRIQAAYQRQGYPFARVRLRRVVPPPGDVVHMVYLIAEGPPAQIERLTVHGLTAMDSDVVGGQIRAILRHALGERPLVSPLLPGDGHDEPAGLPTQAAAGGEASWRPPPSRRPAPVPADKRWVPDLYQEAMEHLAQALREAGYLQATVELSGLGLASPASVHDVAAQAAAAAAATSATGSVAGAAGGSAAETAGTLATLTVSPLAPLAPLAASGGPARQLELACASFVAEGGPAGICPLSLAVRVQEGEQAFIHSIAFVGPTGDLGADALLACVEASSQGRDDLAPVAPGQPLAASASEEARIALVKHLRDRGYLYARVSAEATPLALVLGPAVWWNLTFTIDAGPQVVINQVLLRGNRFTREGVIASRMGLASGDVYQLEQAIADQRAIGELGVFRHVRVRLIDEERPGRRKDVVAEVTERQRQLIEVAPGLSSANGPRLRASYSHLNLAGTASSLVLQARVNRQIFFALYGDRGDSMSERFDTYRGLQQLTRAIDREARIGLRSPPIRALLFDPLFRLDLVELRINAVRYSLDSRRVILGVDGIMPHRLKGSLETQLGLINLECNPSDPFCNQERDLRHMQSRPLEVGQHWIFKGGPSLAWDRRDSPLSPRRGALLTVRLSGALGSQLRDAAQPSVPFSFLKADSAVSGYLPLGKLVLALGARVGLLQRLQAQAPLDERFFLGGRDSLRGFFEGTLIPQDACFLPAADSQVPAGCAGTVVSSLPNPDGSPNPPLSSGGNVYMLLKVELRVPVREQIALSLFADLGNLWLDFPTAETFALRQGVGVGLRYTTPVGALALDFGVNPTPRPAPWDETRTQLHFSIGSF